MAPSETSPPDHANVIAPPPLLLAGTLAIGFAADVALGTRPLPLPDIGRAVAALALVAGGLSIAFAALRRFRRAKTAVRPWVASTAIVTGGVYRHTRNPMYLSFVLVYLGLTVWLGGWVTLALLAPFLVVMHYGVILREERYLAAKFGEPYRAYTREVRRWI